jgi:competence protein ComEC
MTWAALAFAAGAALLQQQAALPSIAFSGLMAAAPILVWWQRSLLVPAAFVCGFLWAALCAHARMAEWLAPQLEGVDLEVAGVVAGLPAVGERGTRFEFDVEAEAGGRKLPRRIVLSWYRSPLYEEHPAPLAGEVHPGERWLFTVRLRRPHGLVNPHGYDYEAWLLERGIGATGYVRARGVQRLVGHRNSALDRVEQAREAVRERFMRELGATPAAGILAALAVGDQRAISAEEWRLFHLTGVTHLMSISGLHVTLVSGLAAWLVGAGWRRLPRAVLRLPSRKAAALAAVMAALVYTLLAGFAVPAQRTFYMVSVVAVALWAGRVASPLRTLALALAIVVAADPWAPLSPGMWLSFGAVALIFYVAVGWSGPERRLAQWGRTQWAVTIGLAPAALLLFAQVSLAGPLANALAIPVVSVIITPLALFAAVLPFQPVLDLASWLVGGLLQFLEWCAALPGALWRQHVPAAWSIAAALAGALWMLAPRGVPWRAAGAALMAPAFLLPPRSPAAGEAWVSAFDVGQGLAVLVRTEKRALLYDAGPAFGALADSGERVLLPALRGAGLERLDLLVLTHEDVDHIGGALSVLEALPVEALASSLPPAHPLQPLAAMRRPCAAGEAWEWDGVRFSFLHPPRDAAPARRNDRSCVLRVSTSGASMLLTGDIERSAEDSLVAQRDLKSDVMLVPHHGSRSSSSGAFIAAVAPRAAVVAAGYRNRFGHPSGEVLERYAAAGVRVWRTDLHGSIHVRLAAHGALVQGERAMRARYWLQ